MSDGFKIVLFGIGMTIIFSLITIIFNNIILNGFKELKSTIKEEREKNECAHKELRQDYNKSEKELTERLAIVETKINLNDTIEKVFTGS